MKRNAKTEQSAARAALYLKRQLRIQNPTVGIILGTGWGGRLGLEEERSKGFESIPGFSGLQPLVGHARKVSTGICRGKEVVVLNGRVHLNEAPAEPEIYRMVRLQTEMLLQLGIRKLIVTCAAGALPNSKIPVGTLVIIDSFVTVFAPDMPLYAGEFCSPEDVLSKRLLHLALDTKGAYPNEVVIGSYAMLRGPFFEGRMYDKAAIRATGASIVGMSTLPEACIAALYQDMGVEMLALAFVTNDSVESHSHETNVARADKASEGLGEYLGTIIEHV